MPNLSSVKAIRTHCLDCCCGDPREVRLCTVKDCALYEWRFGRSPEAQAYREEYAARRRQKKCSPETSNLLSETEQGEMSDESG